MSLLVAFLDVGVIFLVFHQSCLLSLGSGIEAVLITGWELWGCWQQWPATGEGEKIVSLSGPWTEGLETPDMDVGLYWLRSASICRIVRPSQLLPCKRVTVSGISYYVWASILQASWWLKSMAFGQNPNYFYLVAVFGSCLLVSVLFPVFSFACWTRGAVTLRLGSSCYCKDPSAITRLFTTVHCHIVLTSPKIILAMLVNIHSSLEGRVFQEMEGDVGVFMAEGTTMSMSLHVEGHRIFLFISCTNECVFFRNNIMLGLNIGSSGGFRTIFSKLLHQQFLPTVEYTVTENEHAHLQHPPMEILCLGPLD